MIEKIDIIIPEAASFSEDFAAKELKFFLNEITGASVSVFTEDKYAFNGRPFFSLGTTSAFEKSFGKEKKKLDVADLDGYFIAVKENCAYVCGGAGQGTIFGVYRLLKELFGLEIYAETVYTYDKKPLVFRPCVIKEKPDIPMRSLGIYPVHLERRQPSMGNKRYCYRMRLRQMDEGWGINNHSYFRVLPPSVYHKDHPTWYDETISQLCLTNEGVIAEYVKNMKTIIENTPDDIFYMFGQEDTLKCCNCEKCRKIMDKYNGFSGLTLIFANRLAKELNVWLKKAHPERKVYFFTFAYHWSIVPPVVKTADGRYEPMFKDLKLEKNLGVLIAPLLSSSYYAMNDPKAYVSLSTKYRGDKRISLTDVFYGWRSLTENIAVWTYNHNFYDYMTPCPMWQHLGENIRWFKQLGALHVFIEAGCTVQSNFAAMKTYVCSKLMWNTELNQEDLIRNFMSVYYKGAEKEMFAYFRYIHEHAEWLKNIFDREPIFVHFDDDPNIRWLDERFWTKNVLLKCIGFFDDAVKNDISEEVLKRVLIESLPAKFSYLYLYRKETDERYALSLMDEILEITEKAGIKYACDEEPKTFVGFISSWKKEITEV